jgi:hypothetical protein
MWITLANFWRLLGGLLVLANLANRFSHRTRVGSPIGSQETVNSRPAFAIAESEEAVASYG